MGFEKNRFAITNSNVRTTASSTGIGTNAAPLSPVVSNAQNPTQTTLWFRHPCSLLTIAGDQEGFSDGIGGKARFTYPTGICWNPYTDCLYVCDFGNNAIRRCTRQGLITSCI